MDVVEHRAEVFISGSRMCNGPEDRASPVHSSQNIPSLLILHVVFRRMNVRVGKSMSRPHDRVTHPLFGTCLLQQLPLFFFFLKLLGNSGISYLCKLLTALEILA
jgi:hypothetical protein